MLLRPFLKSPSVIFHNLIIVIVSSDGEDEKMSYILLQELFAPGNFSPCMNKHSDSQMLGYGSVKSTVKVALAQGVRCIFIPCFLMTGDDPVPSLSPVTELN